MTWRAPLDRSEQPGRHPAEAVVMGVPGKIGMSGATVHHSANRLDGGH